MRLSVGMFFLRALAFVFFRRESVIVVPNETLIATMRGLGLGDVTGLAPVEPPRHPGAGGYL